MLKIVALIKRKTGLSHEEFRSYYESNHRKLVKIFSEHILDYRRTYPAQDRSIFGEVWNPSGKDNEISSPFDCMTEIWVKDVTEMNQLFQKSAASAHIFEEDESRFMDRGSIQLTVCEEFDVCEALGRYENSGKAPFAAT